MERSDREYPAANRTKEPTGDALSHREALRKCASLEKELAEAKGALDDVEAELCSKQFSLSRFEQSDSDIQYYTGFPSIVAFDACVRFLRLSEGNVISCRSQSKDNRERSRGGGRKSKMTLREKFFITLVRLRQGIDLRMLADLYFVDSSTMSRIIHTMITLSPSWPAANIAFTGTSEEKSSCRFQGVICKYVCGDRCDRNQM